MRAIQRSITDHKKKKTANTNITILLFSFAFLNSVYPIRNSIADNSNAAIVIKKRWIE